MSNLGQNSRLKGKFLDLKTDAGEVLGLEQGSYAVKRGLLACEMGAKQLPQWFYTGLRSKRGGKNQIYRRPAMNYEEQRKNYGALARICPME